MEHTIEETLDKFALISGAGNGDTEACVMTALSWANGDAWGDHLACAHRLINSAAITANDDATTTPEQRAELVRAGATGILDTWWVPDIVVVWALSQEPSESPWFSRVLRAVVEVGTWKIEKPDVRSNLRSANLRSADLRSADLGYADLRSADLRSADLRYADLRYADLRSADLRYANLGYADLRSADLRSADLGSANLRYADLRYARANQLTLWPDGFDIVASGVVVVSE